MLVTENGQRWVWKGGEKRGGHVSSMSQQAEDQNLSDPYLSSSSLSSTCLSPHPFCFPHCPPPSHVLSYSIRIVVCGHMSSVLTPYLAVIGLASLQFSPWTNINIEIWLFNHDASRLRSGFLTMMHIDWGLDF